MFPRTSRDGREFVTDRAPSSGDLSNMIVDGLRQVGLNTTLFSGISARREGLSSLHHHRGGRSGAYPLDAERQRAGRRGAAICPARQPRAAVRHVGGLRLLNSDRNVRLLHCSVLHGDGLSDPGLGPLRFRDPGRPSRAGPCRDRQSHGGHAGGERDQGM
jgi:hypothetical protein